MDRNRPARELPLPVGPASTERWVINLRAAMAPLQDDAAVRERYAHLRVFHVARIEDGRHRYRLRLGFFATRAEAESHIVALRAVYPAAFACAAERDDLRHAAGFAFPDTQPASVAGELTPAATIALLEGRQAPAAPALERVAPPMPQPKPEISELQGVELTLVDDEPVAGNGLAATDFPAARAGRSQLAGAESADWFAIELMACGEAPTQGSLPRLDIFAAYSVYSVTLERRPSVRHAIRLGFFRERVSADQVAAYVRSAFPDVSVVPVSRAERDRHVSVTATLNAPPGIAALEVPAPPSNVIELAINRDRAATDSTASGANGRAASGDSRPRAVSARAGSVRSRTPSGNGIDTARSGKHRTLGELLVEEARQTVLSESGIRRVPQSRQTLLGRLVERLKR